MIVHGTYRGTCLDNKDPLGLGRIRVQVPAVLGSSATGWAFPSWTRGDLDIWPEDRVPEPGQGVWVQFEGTDRPTWTAVFGPQEFSEQHRERDPGYYDSSIAWELGPLPASVEVPVSGTILGPGGVPEGEVLLQRSADGTSWRTVARDAPSQDGSWEIGYARPASETGMLYRAHYPGSDPFTPSTSDARPAPDPADHPVLEWDFTAPSWQSSVQIRGSLVSQDGSPVRDRKVVLYARDSIDRPWRRVQGIAPATTDRRGRWTMSVHRPYEQTTAASLKAVFHGDERLNYAETTVGHLPEVRVEVPISWTPIVPTVLGVPLQVSGTVGVEPYGLAPDPTVLLQVRAPSIDTPPEGEWYTAATAVPDARGRWSLSYTPDRPSADYRAAFAGSGPWQPSETAFSTSVIALTTSPSPPALPALVYGSSFTATGTVYDQLGRPVRSGAVVVEFRPDSGPDVPWAQVGPEAAVSASGTYSVPLPGPSYVGPASYRARYLDNPGQGLLEGLSQEVHTSCGLAAPVLVRGSWHSTTEARYSWSPVPGAVRYDSQAREGSGAWYDTEQDFVATSFYLRHMKPATDYAARIRAEAVDAGGSTVFSPWSSPILVTSGRDEQIKEGEFTYTERPTATGTWRPVDGWAENGDDVVQGYFSYSDRIGYGVMTYNGQAFRNWVTAHYGADVLWNLNSVSTEVRLYRMPGGENKSLNIRWHVTGSTAHSGGRPNLAGGSDSIGILVGANAWVMLPYAHWGKHVLMNEDLGGNGGVYTVNSFCIYYGNSANYAKFYGKGDYADACNIRYKANWRFVSVPYLAPRWR